MKHLKYILFSLIALIAFAAAPGAFAQTKKVEVKPVDFDRVKALTQNPQSRYYYPKLIQHYLSNTDTTMQLEDYRCLYYGYIYQEDYNPYRQSVYTEKVDQMQLAYKKTHTRAECDSIEKYAELSLNDNMFDFEQMEDYIYVLKEKKKHARAEVRRAKFKALIQSIMTSGKGTKEEPWVVICPAHEYFIINELGFIATNIEEQPGGIDYVTVEKKENSKVEGFYFDVSKMLAEAKRKGYE